MGWPVVFVILISNSQFPVAGEHDGVVPSVSTLRPPFKVLVGGGGGGSCCCCPSLPAGAALGKDAQFLSSAAPASEPASGVNVTVNSSGVFGSSGPGCEHCTVGAAEPT